MTDISLLLTDLPTMPLTQRELEQQPETPKKATFSSEKVEQVQLSPMWTLGEALENLRKSTQEFSNRLATMREENELSSDDLDEEDIPEVDTPEIDSEDDDLAVDDDLALPWLFEHTNVKTVPSNGNLLFSCFLQWFVSEHMQTSSKSYARQQAHDFFSGTLLCPITREPLKEEVGIVSCCYCMFSGKAIQRWLQENGRCPNCRESMPEVLFFSQESKTKFQVLMETLFSCSPCSLVLKPQHFGLVYPYIDFLDHVVLVNVDLLSKDLVWHQHVVCFDDQKIIDTVLQKGKPETLTIIS
jgi:hypothetical protein